MQLSRKTWWCQRARLQETEAAIGSLETRGSRSPQSREEITKTKSEKRWTNRKDCGGGEESADYCARTGEKLRGLSGQDSNEIRKCPTGRRALSCSHAGTAAKTQGLGKRALSHD